MTKRMNSNFRRALILGLTLSLLLFNGSCGRSLPPEECSPDVIPPPRSAFAVEGGTVKQTADAVSKDVGKVIASGQGSKNQTVFVFEETHDSIVGQLEIAVMLWRLQKNHGLRQVSLEGAFSDKGDLPAKWFHDLSGGAKARQQAARETALTLLREGEISSAEFIALVQPGVRVKGNEVESEYSVEESKTNGALDYLIGIAEKSLTPDNARRADDLARAGKIEEALDVVFRDDPWSRERYQKLYGDNISSTEEETAILREVEEKVEEEGIEPTPEQKAAFREDLNFYRTASKRSCTMVKNTLAMMDATSAAPVALIIGAAHTPKVVELIKAAQLNYAVISPLTLSTPKEGSRLAGPMYQRKMSLKSVDGEGKLGTLLSGRKKPPPLSWRKWLQSKGETFLAFDLIVDAAARNERVPSDELKKALQSLQAIKIDWSSMKVIREGGQVWVMLMVTAQTSDTDPARTLTFWGVGWRELLQPLGTQPPNPKPPVPRGDGGEDDFDKLIVAARDEEKRKGEIEEAKPGEVAVVQLTTKTRAAFSTDQNLLQKFITAR